MYLTINIANRYLLKFNTVVRRIFRIFNTYFTLTDSYFSLMRAALNFLHASLYILSFVNSPVFYFVLKIESVFLAPLWVMKASCSIRGRAY